MIRFAFAAVMLLGCSSDSPSPEPPLETQLGTFGLRLEPDPAQIEFTAPDGSVLLRGLPGGVAGEAADTGIAFRTGNATFQFEFGSFRIEEFDVEPWTGVDRLSALEETADGVGFTLRGGNERLGNGTVAPIDDRGIAITIQAEDPLHDRASFAFECEPDEHFLGFGGQSFDVDHRGQRIPIWVQEDGITKVDNNDYLGPWMLIGRRHSTHTPMPIFVSSRGYAVILDTPYRSIFDMCSEDEGAIRIEAWEGELKLRVFWAGDLPGAVELLTGDVGRPELPPTFAFAPWLDAIFGPDNVRRVATALRTEGIPTSIIWTEDFRGGGDTGTGYGLEEDWRIDRDLYPDFEALADELHGLGFKFLTYNNTFLVTDVDVYDEAVSGGHVITKQDGSPFLFFGPTFEETTLVDLSSPTAVEWMKDIYREQTTAGADGWMADFAEWLPHDAVLASGEDALAAHNLYPVEYARANRELMDALEAEDGVERLFFMRAAYLGSQPLVSVVWAGDQQTDFTLGDGYPSVIPMGIGLGVTGFPYFGHDIAGYMSELTVASTKELFFRWTTFGALSPIMRTHHGREARMNWNWESDADTTAHFRRWTRLHQQLFVYLLALGRDAAERGHPMMRPLAFHYPDFEAGWTATDQYMLGSRIIVAPIIEEGATSRTVALPDEMFYPLLGGTAVSGTIEAAAGPEEIPAFVPAGSMLVLLPDGVDTVVDTTDPTLTTLESVGDDREIWLYRDGADEFMEHNETLSYRWEAGTLSAVPTTGMWNGTPVSPVDGVFEVTGTGTLTFDDGGSLTVTGGTGTRSLRVVIR
ncbi:MAG: TIM-barrel domain-containing protein [Myxococcota bacterium]